MSKITKLFSLLFFVILASSCNNEKSLQRYLVDTNGKPGFITGDLPISTVLSPKADVSKEVKETIKSIKKINVTFLPKTNDNSEKYEVEKVKLKTIFKGNKTYKDLLAMKIKGMNVKIYFAGDTNKIDEVIAFGYGENIGVGVARLLGENMNPAKIINTLKSMDFDEKSPALQQFASLFTK